MKSIFLKLHKCFLFVAFPLTSLFSEAPTFTSKTTELVRISTEENKKIAVCYWGLTRSTKKVFESHYQNLFDVLNKNNVKYDVFMHTWKIQGKQRIWEDEINKPIDYEEYKLLNPDFYKIDDQDEFINQLDFGEYYYEGDDNPNRPIIKILSDQGKKPWLPIYGKKTVKMLVLNHLCALESLKRVTEMVENCGTEYDLIMYVRPDVRLNREISIKDILTVKDFDILIPNFEHWGGYNDRFAVLSFNTAPLYAKRMGGLPEFRRTQGYIYSEAYLKYVCELNHLNVKFMHGFHFDIVRP